MKNIKNIMQLNKRIRIEYPVSNTDLVGGYSHSWKELGDFWADIIPIHHSRLKDYTEEGLNTGGKNIFEIVIRYLPEVACGMRIIYRGRYYSIKRIINLGEDDRFLNLFVQEIKYD